MVKSRDTVSNLKYKTGKNCIGKYLQKYHFHKNGKTLLSEISLRCKNNERNLNDINFN